MSVTLPFLITMVLYNPTGAMFEDSMSNFTMEPYNFTAMNVTHYDTTAWGMRLFGRLLTPTPLVQRAMDTMIYIIFDCGSCKPDVRSFQKRGYKSGSSWSEVDDDNYYRDPDYYGAGYFLVNLEPLSTYIFRAKIGKSHSVAAYGRTCSDTVSPVDDLRAENIAAAWFDIRFSSPSEDCDGKYYYKFKYMSTDSPTYKNIMHFNNVTRFGMYWRNDSPGRRWIWDSMHPCPPYPDEMCLFLGEHVRPNYEHIVHVKPIRFGATDWEQEGYFINITVKANMNFDKFPPTFCPKTDDEVPLWLVILFWILVLVVIVVIIVLAELLRRQKKKEKEKEGKDKGKAKGDKPTSKKEMKEKKREERKAKKEQKKKEREAKKKGGKKDKPAKKKKK